MCPFRSVGSIHVHEFSNIFNGCMIPPYQGCFAPLFPLSLFQNPTHFRSMYNFVPTDLWTYYRQKQYSYRYMDLGIASTPDLIHKEIMYDCMGQETGYLDHHDHYFYVTSNCQKGLLGRSLLTLVHQYPYLYHKQKIPPLFVLKKWSTYPYTKFEYRRPFIRLS